MLSEKNPKAFVFFAQSVKGKSKCHTRSKFSKSILSSMEDRLCAGVAPLSARHMWSPPGLLIPVPPDYLAAVPPGCAPSYYRPRHYPDSPQIRENFEFY